MYATLRSELRAPIAGVRPAVLAFFHGGERAMPKSRTSAPITPPRPYTANTKLTGGNGSSPEESDTQRFARLESVIEQMRHELDVQLKRIAELQAQLDRAIADRSLPPRP